MSDRGNYTYWMKSGEVRESSSFVEDEQFRKDGWIKSNRGGYEWYKRSLAKQRPADAPAVDERTERLENYEAIFHDVIAGHLTSTPMVMAEHGLWILKQLTAVTAERDAARELLANVERNMPQSEQASLEFPRWAGIAWSAWVACQLIRAYQKQATGGGE